MRKEDWIKVESKLPDTEEDGIEGYRYQSSNKVLALEDGITPIIAIYEKGDGFEHWIVADEVEPYQVEVTHWQEIILP